jgi:hypothetical protein
LNALAGLVKEAGVSVERWRIQRAFKALEIHID